MPGIGKLGLALEQDLWILHQILPRILDQPLTDHNPHNREMVDVGENWSVKVSDLEMGLIGLGELCLEEEDGMRADHEDVGLTVASTIPVTEGEPLSGLDIPAATLKLSPNLPLIRQSLCSCALSFRGQEWWVVEGLSPDQALDHSWRRGGVRESGPRLFSRLQLRV